MFLWLSLIKSLLWQVVCSNLVTGDLVGICAVFSIFSIYPKIRNPDVPTEFETMDVHLGDHLAPKNGN